MSNSGNNADICCGGILVLLFIAGLLCYLLPILIPIAFLFFIPVFIIYILYVLLTGS